MSFADFAYAEAQPGYTYELEKGIIVVDVPRLTHSLAVQRIREAFYLYKAAQPGRIFLIAGGMDSVIRLPVMESERHPDLTIYFTQPPADDDNPWDVWLPDIVVEVVSKSSVQRDYEIKREEYLRAGIRVYVIVDPLTRTALLLTRHGDTWQEVSRATDATLTIAHLPGFVVPLSDVFSPVA
jgi:Uma2 family endonuclease